MSQSALLWQPPSPTSRAISDRSAESTASRAVTALRSHSARPIGWPEPPEPAAFAGLAGEIVELIDPHTEADRASVLAHFLVAFGSCIGREPHALVGASRHGLNLYAVAVGESSKSRKGDSWAPVAALLRRVDSEWLDNRVQSGAASGEGVIHAVRDKVERLEPVKERGRVVAQETVTVDEGEWDKRLLMVEPEFSRVLRVMGRQGSTVSATLRQAYDSGDLRIMTRNSPGRATGAHVSLIGHITRDELRRELNDTETVNGFGNRILWLAVRRSKLLPEPVPFAGSEVDELAARLRGRIAWSARQGTLERDDAARDLWAGIYRDLSAPEPGMVGALLARAEANTLRLSAIYALLDQSPAVRPEHLESALALWRYVERSVRYLFGDATGDPLADTIWRALQAGDLSRTQIRDLFARHESSARIDAALGVLAESGRAVSEQRETGGRPVELWRRAERSTQ